MGIVTKHEPVTLIIGLIGKKSVFEKVKAALRRRFGAIDFESEVLDFDFTDYYKAEMGTGLKRKFLSFKRNIQPADLVRLKRYTNKLEHRFATVQGKRLVNIDPGYLTLSKLVLATTKDHQHRLYLGKGIFAEVTLRFRKKTFTKWDWTYPDYCSAAYIGIFNHIRNNVLQKRRRKHA